MRRSCFIIFLILSVMALNGCQKKVTYSYLMRHPDFLENESLRCSVSEPETQDDDTYCEMVAQAMTDLANMANTQQRKPEEFGLLVMATETDYVNAEVAMRNANKAIRDAKNKLDKQELDTAENQYYQAKKLRDEKHEELGVLFSILKAHSPE
jgi:hypothetical protein